MRIGFLKKDRERPAPFARRIRHADLDYASVPARGYAYLGKAGAASKLQRKDEAALLSARILHPRLRDPNYLVYRERRRILLDWFRELPAKVRVLDVGGRLQPYRPLLEGREEYYVAIDPVFEGLLNVAGVGERLPFRDEVFDIAICTQVLNYAASPGEVIAEIRRVLKRRGVLFLSVPAIFPRYHDQRWRFLPDGVALLLAGFAETEIVPEGRSIAGLCRSINLFFDTFVRGHRARRLLRFTVYPVMNLLGLGLDRLSRDRSEFATNYCCRARK